MALRGMSVPGISSTSRRRMRAAWQSLISFVGVARCVELGEAGEVEGEMDGEKE